MFDAKPRNVARQEADLTQWQRVRTRAGKCKDPLVKQDIEILLKSARNQRVTIELNDRLMLPYFDCRKPCSAASTPCSIPVFRSRGRRRH